jgi:hypothetical protein
VLPVKYDTASPWCFPVSVDKGVDGNYFIKRPATVVGLELPSFDQYTGFPEYLDYNGPKQKKP